MNWAFLLAHHPEQHYRRCLKFGPLALCARCTGLYAAFFLGGGAALLAQRAFGWDAHMRSFEPMLLSLLCIPALIDWALGLFDPSSGTNTRRLLTGLLIGGALSRMIALHLRHPFEGPIWESLLMLAAFALLALTLRWRLGPTESASHEEEALMAQKSFVNSLDSLDSRPSGDLSRSSEEQQAQGSGPGSEG